jgi:signal transduction histidine kinase
MLLVEVRSRRITRANAALGDLLGCPAADLADRPLGDVDVTEGEDVFEHLLLALACGDRSPRKRTWRSAAGDAVEVEVQATRLHGDHGTVLVLYVRDVRPDPSADAAGDEAQQWMARKHEALGRLAVGFAEEFGTILDGVTDTVRGIQKDAGGRTDVSTDLESVLESGAKARKLVREFLAFTGQQALRPETVSLNEAVADAEDTLREGLPQDVGLMFRLCDDPTDVTADPEQVREILVRLVERAHLAMPDGGYVIVNTEAVALDEAFAAEHPPTQPGSHVLLSVTDTGEALDEEAQQRIFEPFYTTRDGQGSGLGLATAYGIVKQSGGTIWVTSRPGAGTTFRVYLPRVEG